MCVSVCMFVCVSVCVYMSVCVCRSEDNRGCYSLPSTLFETLLFMTGHMADKLPSILSLPSLSQRRYTVTLWSLSLHGFGGLVLKPSGMHSQILPTEPLNRMFSALLLCHVYLSGLLFIVCIVSESTV